MKVPKNVPSQPASVTYGRFTYGVNRLDIKQYGEGANLRIGSFCAFSSSITVLLGGNHRTDWISTYPFGHLHVDELGGSDIYGHPTTRGDITIGHDVWVAHGVTILSGVTIGDGAVLATNATVVTDVAPYEIVGGNPAKHIKFRFDPVIIALLQKLAWWDLPQASIREIAPLLCSPPTEELLTQLIRDFRPDQNQEP